MKPTKEQRKAALDAMDRQIAQSRNELLALKAQGVDLSGAREFLATQGIGLDQLLAADTRQKRLALAGPVKAALALPADPIKAERVFMQAYLGALGGELMAIAESGVHHSAPGQLPPFSHN